MIGGAGAALQVFAVMKWRFALVVTACALCLGAAGAWARPPEHPQPPPASPSRNLSLEQAVQQVQHQTRGHILAADSVARGHTKVYRIKVLTPKGTVRVMQLHSNAKPKADAGGHDPARGGH